MKTAAEETWKVSGSVTVSAEASAEAGVKPFASAEVKAGVSATVGSEYANTVSVSNTYETSKTKVEGETQGLSVVLDKTDPKGTYRYVLFGDFDVYCLFKVNPTTRAVVGQPEVTQCVRVDSYTWGIDYEPLSSNGFFGKTASGDLFDIPAIDFSVVPRPTKSVTPETPIVTPPELVTKWYVERTNNQRIKDSYSSPESYTIDPFFDIQRLKTEGYINFNFKLSFDAYEVDDGWVNISINDGNGIRWWSVWEAIDLNKGYWNTIERQFTIPRDKLTTTFTIIWDASGSGADDYNLGTRRITIEAIKE
jgi:hypothetical protein